MLPNWLDDLKLPANLPNGGAYPDYSYGARNFSLFEADVDNDPGNGEEILFYSEGFYDHWQAVVSLGLPVDIPPFERDWNDVLPPERVPNAMTSRSAIYNLIDMADCEADEAVSLFSAFDPARDKTYDHYSGLIRYKGSIYFYKFATDEPSRAYLEIATIFRYAGKRYRVFPVCGTEQY